jgi:hypothetical protein
MTTDTAEGTESGTDTGTDTRAETRSGTAALPGEGTMPRVGVVIIGRNEAAHLGDCIASVRAMRYPAERVEVLYVDSDSQDGSAELAEAAGVGVLRLEGFPMTAARGRNAGWRVLDAPLIFFLDGDVVVDPDFLARSVGHFADPKLVSVWGRLRERHPEASIYNRICDLDWVYPFGPVELFGGIALVRRAGLEEVGGFNEHLAAGEEPELSRRLRERGWNILHTDEPMALHDLAMMRWSQYWRRLVRSGVAYAQVAEMYADTPDPMWSGAAKSNRRRGVFWLLMPMMAVAVALALRSLWPCGVGVLLAAGMVWRSAWKARDRSGSWVTLLLFGVHAQLQQVPILLGQWRYWRSTRAARRAMMQARGAALEPPQP